MDFFIKASHAATDVSEKLASTCGDRVECFFDDNRVIVMLLSFLVACAALFVSYKSYKWQINKYNLDQKDGYWHQSVVLPLFVDKFVLSITKWVDDISSLEKAKDTIDLPAAINQVRDEFKKEISQLASRTQFLCTVEGETRTQICNRLDEIEDCITRYLSDAKETNNFYNPPHGKIFEKSSDIFEALIADHKKFNSKKSNNILESLKSYRRAF
jgi:hypothetical protein